MNVTQSQNMSVHLLQQWITDVYKHACTGYACIINKRVQTNIDSHTDRELDKVLHRRIFCLALRVPAHFLSTWLWATILLFTSTHFELLWFFHRHWHFWMLYCFFVCFLLPSLHWLTGVFWGVGGRERSGERGKWEAVRLCVCVCVCGGGGGVMCSCVWWRIEWPMSCIIKTGCVLF